MGESETVGPGADSEPPAPGTVRGRQIGVAETRAGVSLGTDRPSRSRSHCQRKRVAHRRASLHARGNARVTERSDTPKP